MRIDPTRPSRAPVPSFKAIRNLVVLGIIVLVGLWAAPSSVEFLDATEIMALQHLNGTLSWHTAQGPKAQLLGDVTLYPKRSQYWFDANPNTGEDETDLSIKVRFNDGAEGRISGSIAWEMPLDEKSLTAIHSRYGNAKNLEQDLIRTIVEKSVYMTGPLMSSKESYAERRNELVRYIEDQIENGVYETETETTKEVDPMTGAERTVAYVRIVMDENGLPRRQEEAPLREFNIRTFNLSINQVAYDPQVEAQIAAQQKATMQVETAIAEAKQAEQQAITAARHGEAEAAKAKWEQEVIKAKAVTQAEQQLEVAKLEREAAAQEKQKQILLGEGEAQRRKLVMAADNALDARLEAWVKVNERYAEALQNISQPLVPVVQTGGNGKANSTPVEDLMSMFMVKTAKDLGMSPTPGAGR